MQAASLSRWVRALGREAVDRHHVRSVVRGVEHRNPILVYQMGKVGSSTVVATLESLDLGAPVLHLHRLSSDQLAVATSKQRRSVSPGLPSHLLIGKALRRIMDRTRLTCRIVTLTRDPWARLLSHLFEDRRKKMPDAIRPDGSVDLGRARDVLDVLLARDSGLIDPTRWFAHEIEGQFGVDVFAVPYAFERGYTVIPSETSPVLVIRMEDLNRALPQALAAFLGVAEADVAVRKANEGEAKRYADALALAKASFRPDRELAERMAATRYFQHFYASDPPAWYQGHGLGS